MEIMENVRRAADEVMGRDERKEGTVATAIERQTAKIPSDLFLWAAGASIITSAVLHFGLGRKVESNFVGQWAPVFLLLGIYNKIVKTQGHDQGNR